MWEVPDISYGCLSQPPRKGGYPILQERGQRSEGLHHLWESWGSNSSLPRTDTITRTTDLSLQMLRGPWTGTLSKGRFSINVHPETFCRDGSR